MEHYFPTINEKKKHVTRFEMSSKMKINKRMSGIVIRSQRSILSDGIFMVNKKLLSHCHFNIFFIHFI